MNKNEIIKAISYIVYNYGYFEPSHLYKDEDDIQVLDVVKKYDLKRIATEGGKGDGAEMSYIIQAEDGDIKALFRIDGYYSSWDTNHFENDAYEVEEYVKQVKAWRPVE